MSRVITFSTKFPVHHPRKGQSTLFVEKIWKSLQESGFSPDEYVRERIILMDLFMNPEILKDYPKKHTIRKGKRWKVGDKFSPRVWSGPPYRSKQIIIAPDIEIKRIIEISVDKNGEVFLDGERLNHIVNCVELAHNDGLQVMDFALWLNNSFDGQILIWDESNLPY